MIDKQKEIRKLEKMLAEVNGMPPIWGKSGVKRLLKMSIRLFKLHRISDRNIELIMRERTTQVDEARDRVKEKQREKEEGKNG